MKDYPNDGIAYDAVPYKLPLIPLRGIYMFPHMVIHFDIGRQKSGLLYPGFFRKRNR
jgi:ATP-dependent Lon protease